MMSCITEALITLVTHLATLEASSLLPTEVHKSPMSSDEDARRDVLTYLHQNMTDPSVNARINLGLNKADRTIHLEYLTDLLIGDAIRQTRDIHLKGDGQRSEKSEGKSKEQTTKIAARHEQKTTALDLPPKGPDNHDPRTDHEIRPTNTTKDHHTR